MKTYEERIAAVSEARMQAEYAETEKLIKIFLDGDTVYVKQYRKPTFTDIETVKFVPLQPEKPDDG